jgi:hypothetical protein
MSPIPWDALTFVATVVLIYIAAAERRDRRAADRQVAAEIGAASSIWRSRLAGLPRRRIIAGAGAFIFFILTLILMIHRPIMQGPPGPQGLQGIPGPQGLPGMPDTRIEAAVNAMARILWLEERHRQFQDMEKQYKDGKEAQLTIIRDEKAMSMSKHHPGENAIEQEITNFVKQDFPEK